MRKIKKSKKILLAVAVLVLMTGTVAAVIYSNMLEGQITLVSTYPVDLSWENAGPWTDEAMFGTVYSDGLVMQHTGGVTGYAGEIMFEIVGPEEFTEADIIVYLGASLVILSTTGTPGILTGGVYQEIWPGNPYTETVSFEFVIGAPESAYQITIWYDFVSVP